MDPAPTQGAFQCLGHWLKVATAVKTKVGPLEVTSAITTLGYYRPTIYVASRLVRDAILHRVRLRVLDAFSYFCSLIDTFYYFRNYFKVLQQ